MTNVLIFGDIFGRVGRNAVLKSLPNLKRKYSPDFILGNIDNLTSGRGAIETHVRELERAGFDAFSSGDHIFDNEERIRDYLLSQDNRVILPGNLYPHATKKFMGKGYTIIEKGDKKIAFIHLIGQVFIPILSYNPFLKLQEILKEIEGLKIDGIIVDFHKEASSEIAGMYHIFDGKISCLLGTHTHVQTNDDMISKEGTGFITDVGMNGPLHSVIGAHPNSVRERFMSGLQKGKIEQQTDGNYVISGLFVTLENGKCTKIEKIRELGKL